MSQHEIALKMVKCGMNMGVIISRTQTTLYIISSENHICDLRPWWRLAIILNIMMGVASENSHFKSFCIIFPSTQEGVTSIYL